MEFLDKAKGMMSGAMGQKAVSLISGLIEENGGVHGLVEKLHQGGLGEAMQSWGAGGRNAPVSASQIENALGKGKLSQLAASAGIEPAQAAEHLAKFLPAVINRLAPGGKAPAAGAPQGTANLAGMLKDLISQGGEHAA